MTTNHGYVLAYRTAWTHPAFNDLLEAAIWNFLYQNAFWRDGERNFNGHTFQIKRGQLVISMRFLADGFRISEKGARGVIQKLEKLGMVVIQGTHRASIITICNYDKYQQFEKTEDAPKGNQRANRGRTEDANKKQGNKGNEVNEGNNIPPDGVSQSVWDDFCIVRKAKKAPITKTVIDRIKKEAVKAGWTLEDALSEACARGWQSFKSEWVTDTKGTTNAKQSKLERLDAAISRGAQDWYANNGGQPSVVPSIAGLAPAKLPHIQRLQQAARGHADSYPSLRDGPEKAQHREDNGKLPDLDGEIIGHADPGGYSGEPPA